VSNISKAGLCDGHRRAVLEHLPAVALGQLDVLEAQRGARPDHHARVLRHAAELLVELERELGAGRPVAQLDRVDLRDDAHAVAARAHLVALDEVRAVGQLDLQRRGGHERQAVVRVVREEDRHDRHEHGDGPDEHGVGEDGVAGAPHGESR
jgi:hypothetical protein